VADIATKILGGGRKRNHLVGMILHDVADDPDDAAREAVIPPPKKGRYERS
jgi:hypothetical protein